MKLSSLIVVAIIFLSFSTKAQTLYINEVSQGPSGNKEYVEFIVVGEPSCNTPPPCLDMRGKIIDDNNGYFATGSGTGIAAGAARFSNNTLWECVPVGTIIVIYNNTDANPNLPVNDLSTADGNFLLVIPGNSNLLDRHATIPSSGQNNYSATGWTNGGNWQNNLAMSGGDDSFQIRESLTSAGPTHGVSWGNNNQNNIIYFSGSAAGKVFSMENTVSNDPALQTNWVSESSPANETPGQPNSPQNAAWINDLRNGVVQNNVTVTVNSLGSGCGVDCTGSVTAVPSGGAAPYTFEWSNNATTPAIDDLCAGNYSVTVTDAMGCEGTQNVTISSVNSTLAATVTHTDATCIDPCSGTANAIPTGGTAPYSYSWSNNATTSTIDNLCAGNYTVTITDATNCTTVQNATVIAPTNNISLTTTGTAESCENACDGSVNAVVSGGTGTITYLWSNGVTTLNNPNVCDGSYTIIATDAAGCVKTSTEIVAAGPGNQQVALTQVTPQLVTVASIPLNANIAGGTWTGTGVNGTQFSPQIAGIGTHQVCYTVGSGLCMSTACMSIVVSNDCIPQEYSENRSACPGESITYSGQLISTPGEYPFAFQDINGCDSTIVLTFSNYTTSPINNSVALCLGDSTEVNGAFYNLSQIVHYETIDNNGCILQNSTTISATDCNIPPFTVFIPNTFTPNGDMVNDLFPIVITGGELKSGEIYNRWGQTVKEFSKEDLLWTGHTQNGLEAPDGVYTYVVRIQKDNGVAEQFSGFVTLTR